MASPCKKRCTRLPSIDHSEITPKSENKTSTVSGGQATPIISTPVSSHNDSRAERRQRRRSYSCMVEEIEEEDDHDRDNDFPIFIAMADLIVTPTGFGDPVLRETLCSKIRTMCGVISMAYTNRTTHILAGHANTSKVELANEREIPVVTAGWVDSIWNACQQMNNPYLHASLPQFKNFHFPIFFGLNFVFSKNYDHETKEFYKSLLTTNGGSVGSILKKGSNYLYICQKPEPDRMYLYAQARQIGCVSLSWIMESVNRKGVPKLSDYAIKGNIEQGFGVTFDRDNFFDMDILQYLPSPDYPVNTFLENYHKSPVLVKRLNAGVIFNDIDNEDDDAEVNTDAHMGEISDSTITPDDAGDKDDQMGGTWLARNDSSSSSLEQTLIGVDDKDVEMGDTKMEHNDSDSILEQTIIEVDDSKPKDNLVESLAFSMAG